MNIREDKCLTYDKFKILLGMHLNLETKDKQKVMDFFRMQDHVKHCEKCDKIYDDLFNRFWNRRSDEEFWQEFDEYWKNNVEGLGDDDKPKSR